MSNIETGGPAFPGLIGAMTGIDSDGIERWETEPSGGMLLRDYFAAKAMQGFAADPECSGELASIAKCAYAWADAMLKARQ